MVKIQLREAQSRDKEMLMKNLEACFYVQNAWFMIFYSQQWKRI